mmetsp:Transcript_11740/g.30779  ORF Transcript_11740/g.30779 Transcript_11740/m.30779 type:complete len:225 (+) Transcript_11740:355-1029(+)
MDRPPRLRPPDRDICTPTEETAPSNRLPASAPMALLPVSPVLSPAWTRLPGASLPTVLASDAPKPPMAFPALTKAGKERPVFAPRGAGLNMDGDRRPSGVRATGLLTEEGQPEKPEAATLAGPPETGVSSIEAEVVWAPGTAAAVEGGLLPPLLTTWLTGVVSARWCRGCGVAAGRSGRLPIAVGRTARLVMSQRARRPAPLLCVATKGRLREDHTTSSPLHPA